MQAEKQAYIVEMRRRFCPAEMLSADGALNAKYFEPPPKPRSLQWSEEETQQLIQGICAVGVGGWADMRDRGFVQADRADNELRIQTMLLFGRQDVAPLTGWRGTPEQIEQLRSDNVKLAEEKGLLVHGVLADERFGVLI